MREFTTRFEDNIANNILSLAATQKTSADNIISEIVENFFTSSSVFPDNIDELLAEAENSPLLSIEESKKAMADLIAKYS